MSSSHALRRATVVAVDDKPANLVALHAALGGDHDLVDATSDEERATCRGTRASILGSASPLLGLDDAVVGAVIVIQDMTEPRKLEADLEQRIAKLFALGVELEHTAGH